LKELVTINKDEILKQGYVDVKVYVSGLRQSHRLKVVKGRTAHGLVPFLEAKHYIPATELAKLAEQLQLPVKHKDTVVFPKGKMPKDFVIKGTEPSVSLSSDTVEAEVED